MITPIPKPDDSDDYTHMGNYKGPKGHRFTTGASYNLIYESMSDSVSARDDAGNWKQLDGCYFDVTHDYSRGGGIPNVPSVGNAVAPKAPQVRIRKDSDLDDACDMTGITVTNADDMYTPEQENEMNVFDAQYADDPIPTGPESTSDLRQYRFKPDLF